MIVAATNLLTPSALIRCISEAVRDNVDPARPVGGGAVSGGKDFSVFPNRGASPCLIGQLERIKRPVRLSAFGPIPGQSKNVEIRTLCQFRDTCPELNEVLPSSLAHLPLKIRS
jgi:hypothetical protein